MCVKIIKDNIETAYNIDQPLDEQVVGSSGIIVHYQPNDEEITCFLKEIQRCISNGNSVKVNVNVKFDDSLNGFKVKNKIKKALNDINFNEVIKLLALSGYSADQKLEELSLMCATHGKLDV